MTSRRTPAIDCHPATAHDHPAGRWRCMGTVAAALLLAPVLACAQQAPASDAAPAPAARESADTPRPPGATTTGRPLAPAVPAPGGAPAPAPIIDTAPVSPTASAPLSEAPHVSLPPALSTPGGTNPGAGSLLQTILALLLVLGLLVGLAWAMKRYGPRMSGASADMRVVGSLSLGGRERIVVVEIGEQWIVVGAAPGRVNALHTMARQEGTLSPSGDGGSGAVAATSFPDWLKKTIDKRNAR